MYGCWFSDCLEAVRLRKTRNLLTNKYDGAEKRSCEPELLASQAPFASTKINPSPSTGSGSTEKSHAVEVIERVKSPSSPGEYVEATNVSGDLPDTVTFGIMQKLGRYSANVIQECDW